jgi:hypothetical protein
VQQTEALLFFFAVQQSEALPFFFSVQQTEALLFFFPVQLTEAFLFFFAVQQIEALLFFFAVQQTEVLTFFISVQQTENLPLLARQGVGVKPIPTTVISVVFSTKFSMSQFPHFAYSQAGVRGSWTEVGRTEKVSNSGRVIGRCNKVLGAASLRRSAQRRILEKYKVLRIVYFKISPLSVTLCNVTYSVTEVL